jgi:hypothetical protein
MRKLTGAVAVVNRFTTGAFLQVGALLATGGTIIGHRWQFGRFSSLTGGGKIQSLWSQRLLSVSFATHFTSPIAHIIPKCALRTTPLVAGRHFLCTVIITGVINDDGCFSGVVG